MSEANELLESLTDNEFTEYSDPGPVNDILTIDAETRTINVPDTELLFGVETDKDVERKHFRCPRIVGDNIDLSTLSLRIPYRNANNEDDEYIVENVFIDGDYIRFSWLLSERLLKYKGSVCFAVCAVKALADGTLKNVWNTTLASGTVLEGLPGGRLDDFEEEQARDVVTQLIAMLETKGAEGVVELQNETAAQIAEIEKKGDEILKTIPEDYQATYRYADEGARAKADAVTNTLKGTALTGNDCSDDYLRQLRIFGKSVQEPTTGAQLFDADAIGVNLYTSVDAEGVIRIDCNNSKGTSAKYATFYTPASNLLQVSTQYALILEVMEINESSAVVYLTSHYSEELSQFDDTASVTNLKVGTYVKLATTSASFSSSKYMCRGFINIPAGTHVKAAIRISVYADTSVTADTFVYEKFTGGIAGPNPTYPIPVVNVGQKLASGANLFKLEDKTFKMGNITWTVKNGVVRVKGIVGTEIITTGNEIKQDFTGQSGTFTISGSSKDVSVYLNVCGVDGIEHWYSNCTITLDGTETKVWAYLQINDSNTEIDDVVYPMINRNSTVMPWEPWTNGEKKVVDLGLNTKLFGKNLIKNNIPTATNAGVTYIKNDDGSVTINGTPTDISYYTFSFHDEIPVYDTDLTISLGNNNGKVTLVVGYFKSNGAVVNDIANVVDGEVTFRYPREAYKTRTFITVSTGLTFDNLTVYPMMRIASESNRFDGYKALQQLDFDYSLPGLEVTDSSIATYTDSDGKMYYADEIDCERGVYIQRILKKTYDGSSDEIWTLGSHREPGVTWNRFETHTTEQLLHEPFSVYTTVVINALCDHFKYEKNDHIPKYSAFRLSNVKEESDEYQYMLFNPDTSVVAFEDVDAWRTWLQENPITVYLPLAEPIETPLTYEEIEGYRAARTNKYNTTIVNSDGAYMESTYNRDIKLTIGCDQSTILLSASAWEAQDNDTYYTQVVAVDGVVTENTKIDLQPTAEQLVSLMDDGISMFAANDKCVITVYSVGGKPTSDITFKITKQEVVYI